MITRIGVDRGSSGPTSTYNAAYVIHASSSCDATAGDGRTNVQTSTASTASHHGANTNQPGASTLASSHIANAIETRPATNIVAKVTSAATRSRPGDASTLHRGPRMNSLRSSM